MIFTRERPKQAIGGLAPEIREIGGSEVGPRVRSSGVGGLYI
jgi:hypothetical protein